jgi:hypothetical protein
MHTLMETSDGYGDLHKGRMEDDEDGGTPMPSATGTLDRKTSQAPPTTCFQPNQLLTNATRPTNNDDTACGCHDDDENDGRMMTMMKIAARRWSLLDNSRKVDSMVLDYQVRPILLSPLSARASSSQASVLTRESDLRAFTIVIVVTS